jgi:UDP-glucose:(glucosyl)LPS alpha-1,2-glucosyltransferase
MADAVKQSAPMGGSELILNHLKTALPELTDKVQIIVSRPQQVELDSTKPKILWLQDLPQDPNSACLADPGYRRQFNRIVCVSHWQEQQYNATLRIPYSELSVIKNAVPRFPSVIHKPEGNLRFIYTSTPHRGLAILGAVADALVKERQDWQLDVYSSLNIYGWHDADKQFEPLYDTLRANPCVNYHGSQPNAVVRQAVQDAHVFVYPSIYMETSCMAIQEAMMAGCLAITTNLGALPETCAEWAWMIPVDESPEVIAQRTLDSMKTALDVYRNTNFEVSHTLAEQVRYFQKFWSFESRVPLWKAMLEAVIAEGPKTEMVVFE